MVVIPSGTVSRYVYMGFLFGSTAYTPDPVSQNPNDHSLPMTSSPPWKIPPMDSSRVTALILWIAVFVLSEPELVMSYTWRLTSMVKHYNEIQYRQIAA
eukprot:CAMPEP_0205952938 /NCGR_PEP_ID=MMETSP1459-20131121/12925_1 /ASSEMBLY_ACC=CAM_ASM_001120 /TAXON_ID=41880 /ORGANISM="Pycnococcus provasolii, Strain RCC931" /LENGTH=98 /DNA_ID=CAMNT_0053324995 /DNA_START=369 /DNA_END=662 /DNA_ORIENTATION=+